MLSATSASRQEREVRNIAATWWMLPTLAYQEPDADPRHVEAVEPSLDVESNVLSFVFLLPLEHALRDGSHSGIMALLDGLERLGETLVVVMDLGRPFGICSPCIVSAITTDSRKRSSEYSFFSQKEVISYHRPLLNRDSKPASARTTIPVAQVFLDGGVRCGHGERDVALVQ